MKFIKIQSITLLLTLNLILHASTHLLTRRENRFQTHTSQFQSRTNGNDWGQGNIFYLDRHSLDCGANKVIQGFHLIRPRPDQIGYEYACGGNPSLVSSETYNTQTPWNATSNDKNSSTNYLDRHNVQCKPSFALQQFKLIRNGDQIAYQYRCAKLAKPLECKTDRVAESHGNTRYETIYLDRQKLFVGGDRALTQFKLGTRYQGGAVKYSYGYTSCKMGVAGNPAAPRPAAPRPAALRPSIPSPAVRKFTPPPPVSARKFTTPSLGARNPFSSRPAASRPSAPHPPAATAQALTKIPVFNKVTRPNDWGNGNIFYLDRHDVECGNGFVMQGFHLKRPTPNTIAYEYACQRNVGSSNPNDSYTKNTEWNETGNNPVSSTNYLDRHTVFCKQSYALQSFKMIRQANKIAFNFRCAKSNLSDCRSSTTKETDGNNVFQHIYLDRQMILTTSGRVLTQFKLNTRYAGGKVFYHYSYTVCQMMPAHVANTKANVKAIKKAITKAVIKGNTTANKRSNLKLKFTLPNMRNIGHNSLPPQPRQFLKKISQSKFIKSKSGNKHHDDHHEDDDHHDHHEHHERKVSRSVLKKQWINGARNIAAHHHDRVDIRNSKLHLKKFENHHTSVVKHKAAAVVNHLKATLQHELKKPHKNKQTIKKLFEQYKKAKKIAKKTVTPFEIKPKKLTLKKKMIIKEGNIFCESFCESNPDSKEKKCFKNGKVQPCFSCKTNDPAQNKDANKLCKKVCNAVGKSNSCSYYSYINRSKKNVKPRLLSKFGLKTMKHFLKLIK